MRRSRIAFWILAGLCVSGALSIGYARVFWRWNAGRQAARAIEARGAFVGFESAVVRNGQNGILSVLRMDGDAATTLRQLREAFPGLVALPGYGQMLWGDDASGLRLMAFDPGTAPPQAVVILMENPAPAGSAADPSLPDMPADVPAYPGARDLSRTRLDADGAFLAVASSPDAPRTVDAFYEDELARRGWSRMFPGAAGADRFGVYLRPRAVCLVLAEPDGTTGGSRIAVLHRPQGVK